MRSRPRHALLSSIADALIGFVASEIYMPHELSGPFAHMRMASNLHGTAWHSHQRSQIHMAHAVSAASYKVGYKTSRLPRPLMQFLMHKQALVSSVSQIACAATDMHASAKTVCAATCMRLSPGRHTLSFQLMSIGPN